MLSVEEKLSRSNEGRSSEIVLERIMPILEDVKEDALSRMKLKYREGSHDLATLLAVAAELCTLDDIKSRLTQKIKVGRRATKELSDGEPNRDE